MDHDGRLLLSAHLLSLVEKKKRLSIHPKNSISTGSIPVLLEMHQKVWDV